MNQIHIVNTLHRAFFKVKNVSLVVLILGIMFLSVSTKGVLGESVVHTVETKIKATYDGKVKSFTATQNTVEAALSQGGIELGDFDVTEPARNTTLTGSETDVKVVRALPVLISDQGSEKLAFSAYTEKEKILEQLKIVLDPEDRTEAELIIDPVNEGSVGQKIIINRAPEFSVLVDGESKTIKSWGKSVREILEGKVPLGKNDIVEPTLETGIMGKIPIRVTRVNEAEVEETIVVPHETVTKNDYTMYVGQSKTTQEGVNGKKVQKIKITYHNGVEINRQVLSSEVLSEAVTKVIVKGIKPYDAGALWDIIVAASNKYGVDPSSMYRVMMCESGGRVNASNPAGYQGLFQWDGSFYTWAAKAGFPNASIYDPNAQIYATAARVSQNGWSAWGCKP